MNFRVIITLINFFFPNSLFLLFHLHFCTVNACPKKNIWRHATSDSLSEYYLQPWVPRRIHTAEIVVAVRSRDECTDFAVGTVETCQRIEPRHDSRHGSGHHRDQQLALHFAGRLARVFRILLLLVVIGYHLVPKNRSEYRVDLERRLNQATSCGDRACGQRSGNT